MPVRTCDEEQDGAAAGGGGEGGTIAGGAGGGEGGGKSAVGGTGTGVEFTPPPPPHADSASAKTTDVPIAILRSTRAVVISVTCSWKIDLHQKNGQCKNDSLSVGLTCPLSNAGYVVRRRRCKLLSPISILGSSI